MKETDALKSGDVPGQLRCRPQLPQDEPFLRQVYDSTRAEELDLTGWSPEQRKLFLDSQFKAMRMGYASQFPKGEFSIIMLAEQPIGYMVVNRAENELRLADIAILPEFRGRGIGSLYLRQLAGDATVARKPLRLHVFKGSRPWRLYERLGFVKIGDDGPYEHLEWLPTAIRPTPSSDSPDPNSAG
jgi:ribosomal protein S18 acetylase RimI-like enzyme